MGSLKNVKVLTSVIICYRPAMLIVLSITLLTIAVEQVFAQDTSKEHRGLQACGGQLKGPRGYNHYTKLPQPLPRPDKVQQYTTSGLTFTEYMYYDESYKLGERRALTLTDENITRINWLQYKV
ncbi:hypothetical protein HW555_012692 [Spodoptera exigua]|uniref:Uncharacterized protein n=1 Tax=Spodoptera exigua TaxID=7107 RepID=A0A835G6K0_SPOEX|nr:hypothetical protein HW555_012692 [Spodoptera exigua]